MTTTVELSISGRTADDAPLLSDLIDQIQDFFEMVNGVAASISGDDVERFDWRVVGLTKNSPARVTVEAIPAIGFAQGEDVAMKARDAVIAGLVQMQANDVRPLHFTDNVLEVADRFTRRITNRLAATSVGNGTEELVQMRTVNAIAAVRNLEAVRTSDSIHPYLELGSFEGYIQNVGTDGWGRPYIVVKNRVTGADIRCMLKGQALRDVEQEPVAKFRMAKPPGHGCWHLAIS
ncbi:hypothetical protein [Sphingomonas endolithica]|uniref:hypothetical protein n=1 Tax=Sphingomonas endolithica TaxID=2972485 RepID=UPI0021AE395F|nr:hypothetical protein [Sphingomonas sp. ZFBP2030]